MISTGGNGLRPDVLSAERLREVNPRRRVDLLRKVLRGHGLDPERVARNLEGWIGLFRDSEDPALLVLILELLEPVPRPSVEELCWEGLRQESESVRLESLRILMDRRPERIEELALDHLDDEGLEVRMLAAVRLYPYRPSESIDAALRSVELEAHTFREMHALERSLEFLVEEVRDPSLRPRIAALREICEDREGFIDWALETLGENDEPFDP